MFSFTLADAMCAHVWAGSAYMPMCTCGGQRAALDDFSPSTRWSWRLNSGDLIRYSGGQVEVVIRHV